MGWDIVRISFRFVESRVSFPRKTPGRQRRPGCLCVNGEGLWPGKPTTQCSPVCTAYRLGFAIHIASTHFGKEDHLGLPSISARAQMYRHRWTNAEILFAY